MSLLGVVFTLHMIGLVIWLGAAFLLPIAVIPAVRSLAAAEQNKFMDKFTRRFIPWFVIGGITVGLTGWAQTTMMVDDLNIPVMIAKHVAILPLIAVSAYIWFYLATKLSKPGADQKLWTQFVVWGWIQAGLGVIVLILTGWLTG
ncbi:MAG: hypothetical protein ABSA10_09925 [Anaerolineales bacterium]|jgi:uncharacterized membrane protein